MNGAVCIDLEGSYWPHKLVYARDIVKEPMGDPETDTRHCNPR